MRARFSWNATGIRYFLWARSTRALRLLVAVLAVVTAVSCVAVVHDEPHRHGGSHHDYGCEVPPGHLPPPGECRIWYPERPPGHQPPPGDCHELRRHVPRDACLVYGE
jgi:hypothetical protein